MYVYTHIYLYQSKLGMLATKHRIQIKTKIHILANHFTQTLVKSGMCEHCLSYTTKGMLLINIKFCLTIDVTLTKWNIFSPSMSFGI